MLEKFQALGKLEKKTLDDNQILLTRSQII